MKKRKTKQVDFIWKPSEYKLSPMEGRIVLEIDEAGSTDIRSFVATIYNLGLVDIDQLLPKFAAAIERLQRLKLITIKRIEKWNNKMVWCSLDKTEIAVILQYLSDCPAMKWFEKYEYGPCGDDIEICANYLTRG